MLGGSSFNVGTPYVSGAKITAEILEHARAKKIIIFKKRRRKDSRLKQGHRQTYTTIRIKSITA
jgi:large subunit ribosomal protein L21